MASIHDRISELKAKLQARDGTPGFEKNCEQLRIQIARLEGHVEAAKALEPGE